MKAIFAPAIFALVGLSPAPLFADPVADALAPLVGTVVEISGRYRPSDFGPGQVILDGGGSYPMQIAAAPSVVRSLEDCPTRGADFCTLEASAEVSFDGSQVVLMAFEIRNLVTP